MNRIYSALIEIFAAAIFIIPVWCIYNKLWFHNWKKTMVYMIFGFYLTAILALVGFPNITLMKIDLNVNVNVIPFVYMITDAANAALNVLLFIPFGFFLPVLWNEFRSVKRVLKIGFFTTFVIEISQIFTSRATDIDDVITNCVGTLIGYMIAYWFTKAFTRRILTSCKFNDFYIICISVVMIMFFFQPFISSLLWSLMV